MSHFYHDVKRNSRRGVQSLKDGRYVERSTYAKHARRWMDHFGANAHPLKYEHLVEDANAYLSRVTDALGLKRLPSVPVGRANTGFSIVRDGDYLRRREGEGPRLPISELQDIHQKLLSDIKETANITEFDLTDWYKMPEWPSES